MNHKQIIYKIVKDTQNETFKYIYIIKNIFLKKPHKKIFKKYFLYVFIIGCSFKRKDII